MAAHNTTVINANQIFFCYRYGIKNITELSDQIVGAHQGTNDEILDCGKSVNFTYYDNLVGVANRHRHPNVPEPQVALIFSNKKRHKKDGTNTQNGQNTAFDVDALERKLKKAKREVNFSSVRDSIRW